MVPISVAESEKSLVLNMGNASNWSKEKEIWISYTIRSGSNDNYDVNTQVGMSSAEIEAYEISGAYAGIWENSTTSVNMYSSGEEDGAVGDISLFLDSQISSYGGVLIEGQLVRQGVNLFCVQYKDAKVLLNVDRNNAGDIMIDLYINDEFVESFIMTEQYIS